MKVLNVGWGGLVAVDDHLAELIMLANLRGEIRSVEQKYENGYRYILKEVADISIMREPLITEREEKEAAEEKQRVADAAELAEFRKRASEPTQAPPPPAQEF